MRIISKKTLREFWAIYPEAQRSLQNWYDVAEETDWHTFADVTNSFRHADVHCDCVIFDIKGNDFRVVV